jgi:DNA-binding transcriptional LysR family regulator
MDKFIEKHLELNEVLILNNFATTLKYVAIGMGVSILYDYCITPDVIDQVKVIPLDAHFDRIKVSILMRKRKYFSPPTKIFLKTLKQDIKLY